LWSGIADVCETYDDEEDRFRIEVSVHNQLWGRLFGYRGWFVERRLGGTQVPDDVKPVREERRE